MRAGMHVCTACTYAHKGEMIMCSEGHATRIKCESFCNALTFVVAVGFVFATAGIFALHFLFFLVCVVIKSI